MAPVGIHSGHHLKETIFMETFSLEPFSRYSLLIVTSSACRYILGRDAESLPGTRRAEHHIGARTVISICMLSPPTAHTSVSAPHDHILTSLLLAFRYLLAQAPIWRCESRRNAGTCARALGAPSHPQDDKSGIRWRFNSSSFIACACPDIPLTIFFPCSRRRATVANPARRGCRSRQ